MIYHVLPGDAVSEEFRKADIPGEVIVCREAFISGPLDGHVPEEFWSRRAQFHLVENGEDEFAFQDTVVAELEKLGDAGIGDEVNLWFEYELFCSVNMWFCLDRLRNSGANVYRVEPATLAHDDRWSGFGRMGADELVKCFDARQLFTPGELQLGTELWAAFRSADAAKMVELAQNVSPRFPYLAEVVSAAAEIQERPAAILREIKAEGAEDLEAAFPTFQTRAGVYGLGDLQVRAIWDRLD